MSNHNEASEKVWQLEQFNKDLETACSQYHRDCPSNRLKEVVSARAQGAEYEAEAED